MVNHTPTLTSIDKKLAVLCERTENLIKMTEIKLDDNKSEIDRLRNKSNVVDFLLAIGTILAGILGINNK